MTQTNEQGNSEEMAPPLNVQRLLRGRHFSAMLVFLIAFAIFSLSPLHPINDSRYSMRLSECLIYDHTFQLDYCGVPRLEPYPGEDYVHNGTIYQVEQVGPHLFYVMPPGTPILSVPFVLIANAFGISARNPDGTFNLAGETTIELWLAALLMAVLASVFFYTAELLLSRIFSLLVTAGGALGSQVWSTTSRAMFTDTWAILLLGLVILLLLSREAKGSKLRPVLIASLLAWAYLVYPTYAVHVIAISVYLLLVVNKRQLLAYVLTGACWAAGLVIYSWHNFQRLLPSYFRPERLFYRQFWSALGGNLVSPARGVLVFVPTIFFVAYLLVRFRKFLPHRRLMVTALTAISLQLMAIAGIGHWWGGHGYGPRYTTGMVPWFVLLAILGLKGMLVSNQMNLGPSLFRRRALAFAGVSLLAASIWINGRGAISPATLEWNALPVNVDQHPNRLWDWRQPQFLAGLLRPPAPAEFPLVEPGARIDFTKDTSEKYLWYGWSNAEAEIRWTESPNAAMVFALSEIKPLTLQIKMGPFLVPGKLDEQRVVVHLNGERIAILSLKDSEGAVYSINLPPRALRPKNVLILEMPNAASPASYRLDADQRELGIRVEYAQFSDQ